MRIFPSRIQGEKDLGSEYASKKLSIFNLKNCFYALGKNDLGCSPRIRIQIFFHPESRIQRSKKHRIPDPQVKKAPDPGSATMNSWG
jgi:hypothetical protein